MYAELWWAQTTLVRNPPCYLHKILCGILYVRLMHCKGCARGQAYLPLKNLSEKYCNNRWQLQNGQAHPSVATHEVWHWSARIWNTAIPVTGCHWRLKLWTAPVQRIFAFSQLDFTKGCFFLQAPCIYWLLPLLLHLPLLLYTVSNFGFRSHGRDFPKTTH